MDQENNPNGNIFVSHRAIATIAYQTTLSSYGIVGMAPKNIVDGLTNVIVKDPAYGVDVEYDGIKIVIGLFIIVEYGIRIKSVAATVANQVRYQVEKAIGLPVAEVNVHVRGLRISNPD
jgi:uncharacterized alkaline shock family protein YloU